MCPRRLIWTAVLSSSLSALACRAEVEVRPEPRAEPAQLEPASPQPARARAPTRLELRAVELPSDAHSSSASLAVGADALHLVWMSKAETPALMLASVAHGVDAAAWSEARAVTRSERLLINWADLPAVGETPTGRLVAAWPEFHGADHDQGYGLRVAAQLDDGGFAPPWSPDEVRRGPESGFVGFATSPEGLRMFWLDGRELGEDGGTMQLRSVRVDDEGRQAGPSELLDARTCECCKIGVGATSAGAFAAYRDRSVEEVRDIFVAGPGWEPAPVAADGWTITGCPVNGPAVAGVGARAHVAWFTGAGDRSATWIASGVPGEGFDGAQRFDLGEPAGRVDLQATPDGGALVTWLELDAERPGRARLSCRRLGPGGELGDAFEIAELGAARDWGFAKAALRGEEVLWVFTHPDEDGEGSRLEARLGPLPPLRG